MLLSFSREFVKQQLYFSFDSLTLLGADQMTSGDNGDISFYFAAFQQKQNKKQTSRWGILV